jgi:hypothetical protein
MVKINRFFLEKSFSKKKKKEKNSSKELVVGAGLGIGGYGANKYFHGKMKDIQKKGISKEQADLYEKLKKTTKSKIDDSGEFKIMGEKNACYVPEHENNKKLSKYTDEQIDRAYDDAIKKELEKNPHKYPTEKHKQLLKENANSQKKVAKLRGKSGYIIDKDYKRGDILSHELGHGHYHKKEGSKKLGGVLHKLRGNKVINHTGLGLAGSLASGINAAKHEKNGTEEEKISKYGYLVQPGARNISLVGSEAAASHKGMKLLKKHGASKKALKESRGNLGKALGTYAGVAAFDLGTNVAARGLGKYIGRKLDD